MSERDALLRLCEANGTADIVRQTVAETEARMTKMFNDIVSRAARSTPVQPAAGED